MADACWAGMLGMEGASLTVAVEGLQVGAGAGEQSQGGLVQRGAAFDVEVLQQWQPAASTADRRPGDLVDEGRTRVSLQLQSGFSMGIIAAVSHDNSPRSSPPSPSLFSPLQWAAIESMASSVTARHSEMSRSCKR